MRSLEYFEEMEQMLRLDEETLKDEYRPISLKEFKRHIETATLHKVIAACWKYGDFRVATNGIENIQIKQDGEEFVVSCEDNAGDTRFSVFDEDVPIEMVEHHCSGWQVGLYTKK